MSTQRDDASGEREAKQDRENLRGSATIHAVAAMAALTLWGAADLWATVSGWWLARGVALVDAVIAGTVIAGIVHEWGHYAGARLAGAATKPFEKPIRHFFVFDFPFDRNDRRQFLSMSWGGILAPWLIVLSLPLLIPIDNPSRAMLLAVFVTRAAQASFFEVPVVMRTAAGGDPQQELGERLRAGGLATSRYAGLAVGVVAFLAV